MAKDQTPNGFQKLADTPARLRRSEADILRGIFAAADRKQSAQELIRIIDDESGDVFFEFTIRALDEEEVQRLRKEAAIYEDLADTGGLQVVKEVDTALFNSLMIHAATVPDVENAQGKPVKIWDLPQAWERFGVVSGPRMIDHVLLYGRKEQVIGRLNRLSGFGRNVRKATKSAPANERRDADAPGAVEAAPEPAPA